MYIIYSVLDTFVGYTYRRHLATTNIVIIFIVFWRKFAITNPPGHRFIWDISSLKLEVRFIGECFIDLKFFCISDVPSIIEVGVEDWENRFAEDREKF